MGLLRSVETMGLLRAVETMGLLRDIETMGLIRAVDTMGLLRAVSSMGLLRAVWLVGQTWANNRPHYGRKRARVGIVRSWANHNGPSLTTVFDNAMKMAQRINGPQTGRL